MGVRVTREQFIRLKEIEKQLGTLAAMDALRSGFQYDDWEVIRKDDSGSSWEIAKMHWEFIPPWIKNMEELKAARKQGIPWLNATAEKLLESKMFRDAALKRRCLVIASWFFEWRHFKPDTEKKEIAYPYLVSLPDHEYFYMAGIWQPWTDKSTGETMDTFAIVTTSANELMTQVHNKKKRMPTILPEDLAYEWVMGNLTEERIKQIASYQVPSKEMAAYTIKKDFKSQLNPLEPHKFEELPELAVNWED